MEPLAVQLFSEAGSWIPISLFAVISGVSSDVSLWAALLSNHTLSASRDPKVGPWRSSRRRAILAALATLLFVLVGQVPAAEAFSTSLATGYPGTVYVPKVIGNGNNFTVTNQARTITESTRYAGSWQYVCATHRLLAFTPATYVSPAYWTIVQQRKACGYISPSATSIRDAGALFSGLSPYKAYYTDVTVTWQSSGGALLGRLRVNHNQQSDYTCYGPCRTLTTSDGVGTVWFNF